MGEVNLEDALAAADAAYAPISRFCDWVQGPVDEYQWAVVQNSTSEHNLDSPSRRRAINTVLRVAAAESGAIEDLYELTRGQTISIGEDEPGWRARVLQQQSGALDQIDAQIATYEFIRESVGSAEITAAWVRQVHELATAGQDDYRVWVDGVPVMRPLPKGEYKSKPNHVVQRDGRRHSYCPVLDTSPEMTVLMNELQSPEFLNAHFVRQAAYSHWALTHIHPFADGNGRVARALASLFLLKGMGVPLLIFADRKLPYFQALESADNREPDDFTAYVDGRALDTAAWLEELVRSYSSPSLVGEISALCDLVANHGGLTLESPDSAALRVKNRLNELIKSRVASEFDDFPGVIGFSDDSVNGLSHLTGYREIDLNRSNVEPVYFHDGPHYTKNAVSATISMDEPTKVTVGLTLRVFVAEDVDSRTPIRITSSLLSEHPMNLRLDDVSPTLSAASELRLDNVVSRSLANAVQVLHHSLEVTLRTFGVNSRL